MEQLREIINEDHLDYYFQKILESIDIISRGPNTRDAKDSAITGKVMLKLVKDTLNAYRERLVKCEIEIPAILTQLYNDLEGPIDNLGRFFEGIERRETPGIDTESAYNFGLFYRKQMTEEFPRMAAEIERKYRS